MGGWDVPKVVLFAVWEDSFFGEELQPEISCFCVGLEAQGFVAPEVGDV